MRKHLQSVRLRLTLFFVLVTTLTLGGFGLFSRQQLADALEQQFVNQKQGLAKRLQTNLPGPLWNFDLAVMERIVSAEMTPPEVRAIYVQDSRSSNLVGVVKKSDDTLATTLSQDGVLGQSVTSPIYPSASNPVDPGGQSIQPEGHVVVYFSRDPIDVALRVNLRNLAVEIIFVNLVLLVFLTLGLRMVFRPLERLRDAQFALARQVGEEMKPLAPIHLTELDALTQGFNETLSKLKHLIEMHANAEAVATAATQETRQVLNRLVAAQEELVKAGKLAALGRLVAGIAHELNTPLGNGLVATSSLLDKLHDLKKEMTEKGPRRSSFEKFLSNVEDGVGLTLSSLTRSAALVSRFKQIALHKGSVRPSRFELHSLISLVLASQKSAIEAANCRVRHVKDGEMEVFTDPELLSEVITILISNSLVHGFAGGQGGTIQIDAARGEHGTVVIHIQDDGAGIAAEHMARIFDPFFTTRMGQGGSGLGLYIANNIACEILGGSLSARSEPGVGSEFTIEVPTHQMETSASTA